MSNVPANRPDDALRYEIRVQGHLPERWASRFDGFTLSPSSDGITVLYGVVDQAAVHGALHQLADLGLPLVSVTSDHPDEPASSPTHSS